MLRWNRAYTEEDFEERRKTRSYISDVEEPGSQSTQKVVLKSLFSDECHRFAASCTCLLTNFIKLLQSPLFTQPTSPTTESRPESRVKKRRQYERRRRIPRCCPKYGRGRGECGRHGYRTTISRSKRLEQKSEMRVIANCVSYLHSTFFAGGGEKRLS